MWKTKKNNDIICKNKILDEGKKLMGNDILMPDYNHSILSTITSILKYYNVETNHKSLDVLDKILEKKYRNLIFLVLDGLGENILNEVNKDGYFASKKIDIVTYLFLYL